MDIVDISVDGWEKIQIDGNTSMRSVQAIGTKRIQLKAYGTHDCVLTKEIQPALVSTVYARVEKNNNHSDVRVGAKHINNDSITWGHWLGREAGTVDASVPIGKDVDAICVEYAGSWDYEHICYIWDVKVAVGGGSTPSPPPPPGGGIAAQLEEIMRQTAEIASTCEMLLNQANELLEQWQDGQEWVVTYNRNKIGEE